MTILKSYYSILIICCRSCRNLTIHIYQYIIFIISFALLWPRSLSKNMTYYNDIVGFIIIYISYYITRWGLSLNRLLTLYSCTIASVYYASCV